jgi:hypothetical protein
VDRTFDLKEQVFTAYERASDFDEQVGEDGGLQLLLKSEAVASLPKLRRQMTRRSRRFLREIESTVVVLILLMVIYLAGIGSIDRIGIATGLDFLPPVPAEPRTRDIFESGIPGDKSETKEEEGEDEEDQGTDEQELGGEFDFIPICDSRQMLDQAAWLRTQDLLAQLGDRLCCGSATLVLSEALKYQDYATAGDQFSVMAEKIVAYSDQTRDLLAAELLETSVQMQQAGQNESSMAFSSGASALLGDGYAEMAEGLDGLGLLMSQYEAQQRCMTLATWEPGGQLLPAPVGIDPGSLQIYSESVDFLGLSAPLSESESSDTGSGSGSNYYEVPMEDEDVVSSYFSPE